jgi:hypothetical protein
VDLLQRKLHITRKDKIHDNAVATQKKTKFKSKVQPNVLFMRYVMCKNMAEPDRPQMIIQYGACQTGNYMIARLKRFYSLGSKVM